MGHFHCCKYSLQACNTAVFIHMSIYFQYFIFWIYFPRSIIPVSILVLSYTLYLPKLPIPYEIIQSNFDYIYNFPKCDTHFTFPFYIPLCVGKVQCTASAPYSLSFKFGHFFSHRSESYEGPYLLGCYAMSSRKESPNFKRSAPS
jgi:hypothetical protein